MGLQSATPLPFQFQSFGRVSRESLQVCKTTWSPMERKPFGCARCKAEASFHFYIFWTASLSKVRGAFPCPWSLPHSNAWLHHTEAQSLKLIPFTTRHVLQCKVGWLSIMSGALF